MCLLEIQYEIGRAVSFLGPFGPEFPRLEIIPPILQTLWQIIIRRHVKVLCAAGRLNEAAELFYDMIRKFDDGIHTEAEFVDWLMSFRRLCVAPLVKEVDAASRTENHRWIGTQPSAAIVLDPLRDDFSVNLARYAPQNPYGGVLEVAQQVCLTLIPVLHVPEPQISLMIQNSLSGDTPLIAMGPQMKHAALHHLQDFNNGIMAMIVFSTRSPKLDHAGDS
ncbi:hypothetical protein EV424DRAFT_316505 [Suillus variegatus]|nr:hypothetical protein EV424DRAFT_316505 [Suillus variegatus]